MEFTPIDMETWSRKETFSHFMNIAKNTYSMTVKVNVTPLIKAKEKHGVRIYPAFTWIVTKALNQNKQFRMGYDENGALGYYSYLNPSYSVMDKEENVVTLTTEFKEDFTQFYKEMCEDIKRFEEEEIRTKEYANSYVVSTLPWIPFENFSVMNESEFHFLFPMVTWGKYEELEGTYVMPVALQISHAAADGIHCARFYESLDTILNEFAASFA